MISENPEIVGQEYPADTLGAAAGSAESTGADGRGEVVAVVFREQGEHRTIVSPEAPAASSAENGQQEAPDTPGAQTLDVHATPSDEQQQPKTFVGLAGGVTPETPSSEAAHTRAEGSATATSAITAVTEEPSAEEPASDVMAREGPGAARSHDDAALAGHHAPLGWTGQALLLFSLVSGALTHGWHLFQYPLYLTDEGIYMEQAWSVLREGELAPYTYFYDHAPAGWLLISGWASLLPFQFQTFGNAINTGRVLMLILHILSIFLLFHVTYRFSGHLSAAAIACFFFNFSPLAVYYQREVLLDNIMVFWMLLSLYLVTKDDGRLTTVMLSGAAFGTAVVTKENAIFFAPVIGYLLYTQVRKQENYRFALGLWTYMSCSVISFYFLYATKKNELFPNHLNFNLNVPQTGHVSLLYTIWWQLHRGQGSIFDAHSLFWRFGLGIWIPRDKLILATGVAAMICNLIIGAVSRRRKRGYLVASLLGISYTIYLIRGSQMLEFYIVPLIPFLAMNLGLFGAALLQPLTRLRPAALSASVQGIAVFALWAVLLSPTAGYFFVHDEQGKTVPHDLYRLPVTYLQTAQIAFIRQHIPPTARIIIDDDMWVQLHDIAPYYKWAHSHWKAAADPDVRDKIFGKNWRNIDYIVMSTQMLQAMQLNNGDGEENYILEALQHSVRIWDMKLGGIELQIYQVQK